MALITGSRRLLALVRELHTRAEYSLGNLRQGDSKDTDLSAIHAINRQGLSYDTGAVIVSGSSSS